VVVGFESLVRTKDNSPLVVVELGKVHDVADIQNLDEVGSRNSLPMMVHLVVGNVVGSHCLDKIAHAEEW
jgi:hypothetical protein